MKLPLILLSLLFALPCYAQTKLHLRGQSGNLLYTVRAAPAPWTYPTNGLIARWAFDTNYIETIGGQSGTGYLGATFTAGKMGAGAISLDGVNDYVFTPNLFTNGGLWSISLWVNVDGVITNPTERRTLCCFGQMSALWAGKFSETWRETYSLSLLNSNSAAGASTYSNAITADDAGTWRNIIVTYNKNAPEIGHFYRDGIELPVDSGHSNWFGDLVAPLNMGFGRIHDFALYYYKGAIDEVVLWNRVLSSNEALNIFQSAPSTYPATVYAYGADRNSDATYNYYTYTNPSIVGQLYLLTNAVCDFLVVAGGGGGGGLYGGGGGGGGGYIYQTGVSLTASNFYTVQVGKGGAGSWSSSLGLSGSNSVFDTYIAYGGGGGGSGNWPNKQAGGPGGSGGGGDAGGTDGVGTGGVATNGQGNIGGNGFLGPAYAYGNGGGGGGGTTNGGTAITTQGGDGGGGITNAISGSAVVYCAGGGGGGDSRAPATAGGSGGSSGIGGHGGNGVVGQGNGTNAIAFTGSGGGGAGYDGTTDQTGGNGSGGIVIIRIPKSDTIPTNGLISYWSFDGDANDKFGTNNATVVNAVLTNGVKGVANTAYYFDGSTAYLNIGNVGNLSFVNAGTDTAFSVSCWVKTASAASQTLLAKINNLNNSAEYTFSISESPAFSTVLVLAKKPTAGLSDYLLNQSTTLITSNAWNHVVVTYNASKLNIGISLYINGVLSEYTTGNYGTYTGMGATTASARIGEWQYLGGYQLMKGIIDEMRVYGRVLTSNEVSIIYAIEKP